MALILCYNTYLQTHYKVTFSPPPLFFFLNISHEKLFENGLANLQSFSSQYKAEINNITLLIEVVLLNICGILLYHINQPFCIPLQFFLPPSFLTLSQQLSTQLFQNSSTLHTSESCRPFLRKVIFGLVFQTEFLMLHQ